MLLKRFNHIIAFVVAVVSIEMKRLELFSQGRRPHLADLIELDDLAIQACGV